MKPVLKYSLLALALSLAVPNANAFDHDRHKHDAKTAPEVDPSLALSGLALLVGSLLVARARRSKK